MENGERIRTRRATKKNRTRKKNHIEKRATQRRTEPKQYSLSYMKYVFEWAKNMSFFMHTDYKHIHTTMNWRNDLKMSFDAIAACTPQRIEFLFVDKIGEKI